MFHFLICVPMRNIEILKVIIKSISIIPLFILKAYYELFPCRPNFQSLLHCCTSCCSKHVRQFHVHGDWLVGPTGDGIVSNGESYFWEKKNGRKTHKGKMKTLASSQQSQDKSKNKGNKGCGFAEGARAAAERQAQVRASQALPSCPRKHPKSSS